LYKRLKVSGKSSDLFLQELNISVRCTCTGFYRIFSTNIRAPKGAFLSYAFFSSRIQACFFIIRKAKVQRTDDIGSYHTTNNEAEVQRTGIFLCLFEVI
jgi:hypothetical protein